jgi:hypothetical protein
MWGFADWTELGNVLPIALLDQTEQCLGIITASIPSLTALIARLATVRPISFSIQLTLSRFRAPPTPSRHRTHRQHSALRYDFLSFAYDPDRQNLGLGCFATAYSEHVYVSDERLVGGDGKGGERVQELREGVISKTTTVTVNVTTGGDSQL